MVSSGVCISSFSSSRSPCDKAKYSSTSGLWAKGWEGWESGANGVTIGSPVCSRSSIGDKILLGCRGSPPANVGWLNVTVDKNLSSNATSLETCIWLVLGT